MPSSTHPQLPICCGVTFDGVPDGSARFTLFSSVAERIELCLFSEHKGKTRETGRVPLVPGEGGMWSAVVPNIEDGQLYGYRVHGPWNPAEGQFCNGTKVLFDPYALRLGREPRWHESLFCFDPSDESGVQASTLDSADYAALSAVHRRDFDWDDDRFPQTPWEKTVVYEAHVKGLTALHPELPKNLRGTYLGLGSEAMTEHLRALGVTAIELLPVHQHADEYTLVQRNMPNYWGYSTLGYFAPDVRFAVDPGNVVNEFKHMVQALHRAGLEVILDVVYNHTCEGNTNCPTLSFRGIDNTAYYRVSPNDRAVYEDFTGCGNTLDTRNAPVLRLVLDSLRYWVTEMHVDGFRFDLTSALIRDPYECNMRSAFLTAIDQDPVLRRVKLIAEPWDCGMGGYQVGNFPAPWRDWNGQFRDVARMFWRGDGGKIGALASRLSGSSDMFGGKLRSGTSSVNFITAHDGFTLHDLLSYNGKHNEANREENRDGENNNFSFNCGDEGPSTNPKVLELRERLKRNFLATLMFSTGVPMITAGDELGRTQQGNNNAYCQDNEMSWVDWNLSDTQRELLEFTKRVIAIKKDEAVFARRNFFTGERDESSQLKDVVWLASDGEEMEWQDWSNGEGRFIGMLVSAEESSASPALLLMNGAEEGLDFQIGGILPGRSWELLLDTSGTERSGGQRSSSRGKSPHGQTFTTSYELAPRSVVLLLAASR